MRILAYIHTFNDADVIEQALEALPRQTRKPDGVILVDNASTDGTLDRTFPDGVTVIRNPTNLGTAGAVSAGFAHALAHQFDWVWLLDPDSIAEPDALEKQLAFFERLQPSAQENVFFLVGRVFAPVTAGNEARPTHEPIIFTESGAKPAPFDPAAGYSQCNCALWSSSLYRMKAVERVGVPHPDYFADWTELEYGYRARRLGYTSYMVHDAVLHQDVGRNPGIAARVCRIGPLEFRLFDAPPLRCYYQVRNLVYFWLYEFRPWLLRPAIRSLIRAAIFTASFAVRPFSRRRHFVACLRAIRDGMTRHIERRY
jgi:rhamnopyranosyl-N-acetylglucosaminyl-diphospho-decaprenol beta-1,3/1,4-galactofuranosyltransferase